MIAETASGTCHKPYAQVESGYKSDLPLQPAFTGGLFLSDSDSRRPMTSSLTPDLAVCLYSPEALMVYLRRLTDPHLHRVARELVALERTHPRHWAAVEQIQADRFRLYRQGGGQGWRE